MMRLLVSMGLADGSLKSLITPLSMLEDIDRIMIVRDKMGPPLPKVVYYTPPPWSVGRPVIKTLIKLSLLMYVSLKEKPEIIHGYLLVPNGIMAFISGKLTGKKIGVSLLAGPVELMMLTFLMEGGPIGKYAYNRPLPQISGINRVLTYLLRRFRYITVTGNYTKNFLLKNHIPAEKISIIPHAIDPVDCPVDTPKEYDAIFVGRLAQVKHIETFIRAMEMVRREKPSLRAGIIGQGPEMPRLKALAEQLGISHVIDFLGYVPDVYTWYNRARMSIIASEREGFPYSAMESLSCGCPVIASNCGDITDVLIHGFNGILVDDYHDSAAFAGAIIKLLDDPPRLAGLSRNALKSMEAVNKKQVTGIWVRIMERVQGS
jgi:glycosyltransferase involved in cell wall biosynthesis